MESWIHRLPSAYTSFIKFTLEDGKTLKITNKHFIYKSSCESRFKNITIEDLPINPVYAEKVDVNDCLYVVDQVYNKVYFTIQARNEEFQNMHFDGFQNGSFSTNRLGLINLPLNR